MENFRHFFSDFNKFEFYRQTFLMPPISNFVEIRPLGAS
jgi:hypothetical protein